jgi:hypothetical protein
MREEDAFLKRGESIPGGPSSSILSAPKSKDTQPPQREAYMGIP